MTGSVFRSVAPDTAGGFVAPAAAVLDGPDAVGLPDALVVGDDEGVDPHAPSMNADRPTTRRRDRRTAGRLHIARAMSGSPQRSRALPGVTGALVRLTPGPERIDDAWAVPTTKPVSPRSADQMM